MSDTCGNLSASTLITNKWKLGLCWERKTESDDRHSFKPPHTGCCSTHRPLINSTLIAHKNHKSIAYLW